MGKSNFEKALEAAATGSNEKLDNFVKKVGEKGFNISYGALQKLVAHNLGKEKIGLTKALNALSPEGQSYIVNSKGEIGSKAPDNVKAMFAKRGNKKLITNGVALIELFEQFD